MKRSAARSADAIEFARAQRKSGNDFANLVWQMLRGRRCLGQKFRREVPIPPYTVDFCCNELRLVIEIDGQPHFTAEGIEHDRIRDRFLLEQGYRVLRINGYEIARVDGKAVDRIEAFYKRPWMRSD